MKEEKTEGKVKKTKKKVNVKKTAGQIAVKVMAALLVAAMLLGTGYAFIYLLINPTTT